MSDTSSLDEMRAIIAETGTRLFDRHLLDMAGGNISGRVGEVVCISPRYSGPRYHWSLRPEDVMIVAMDGTILEGSGELSRESKVHLRLHKEFGEAGTAVIHAHSRNLLVFAAMARSLPPVLEATRKFGVVPVVDYAPAHSAELSEYVAGGIRPNVDRIRKQAAAVIAPYHGLFAMGKDLDSAADAVERLDTNAYCILMGQMIGGSPMLADESAQMEATIKAFDQKA
ncbi:MAG: class II aldolase/adducin family protein [Anaerolineae bacterium]|nr:class II aldolase/adducin family protein [Anaerolineae bacterium]